MMKQDNDKVYIVSITETLTAKIPVIANSEDEAVNDVESRYNAGEIVLDSENHVETYYETREADQDEQEDFLRSMEEDSKTFIAIVREYREEEVIVYAQNSASALEKIKELYAEGNVKFSDESYDRADFQVC